MNLATSLAASVLLATVASAQSTVDRADLHRAKGPSTYAGIYHVATGTWTRTSALRAGTAPDVIYSNTAPSGYFTSAGGAGGFAPGSNNIDEGGLPGVANGDPFAVGPDRNEYFINGITINYCDFGAPQTGGWRLGFYEQFVPCTHDTTPTTSRDITGLPANGCWIVDIDLTGQEVILEADGGDGWQDDPTQDSFGWSFQYSGADGSMPAGFFLSGDPASTDPSWTTGTLPRDGAGTYYGTPAVCGTTGYLTQDFWYLADPTGAVNGCYWFGGYANTGGCTAGPSNPYASYWIEIVATVPDVPFGVVYCNSNPNSTGEITSIRVAGSPLPADDDVRVTAGELPSGSVGYFITSQTQGFMGHPAGSDGNLCIAGAIGRFSAPHQVRIADANGEASLDTNTGDWTVTAIPLPSPPHSYAATAGITTNMQFWHRDSVAGQATSNFSDGLALIWQ